ncbi:MAG TPA: carboxyl transferase domain-containing protein [Thermoanaerobaculia bacterium]|nr:carboxyl transferase domain-containing protein [Thermoanaerobaculia bacterium]
MKHADDNSTLRQLEVPVLVDVHGTAWAVGAIDVTLRHRGRVLVAEAPPFGLSAEAEKTVRATAAGLAQGSDAAGALTVRFLADPRTGEVRFLEKTAGLPAEHALAEALTGLDLTSQQQHLTRGGRLSGELPEPRGHAFQIVLSARDPEDGFEPRPGIVEVLRLAAGPGLRADAAVEEGDSLPSDTDLALVRLTADARTRTEALARLQKGLARTTAVVRGGATDKAFLTEILDRSEVSHPKAGPGWIDRLVERGEHLSRRGVRGALLAAAIAGYDAQLEQARAGFYAAAQRGRPEVPKDVGRTVELRHRGHVYAFRVTRLAPDLYRLEVDGTRLEARVGAFRKTGRHLTCGRRTWHVSLDPAETSLFVEVDGVPHRIGRDTGSLVRSPLPAVVVSLAAEGAEVARGDTLAVLETMKVETSVLAQMPGRVRKLLARRNAQVSVGVPLLVLDPAEAAPESPSGERARLGQLAAAPLGRESDALERCRQGLEESRRLLLGYDVDPAALRKLVAAVSVATDHPEIRRRERDILETFVDLASLFRRQPGWDLPLEQDDDRHTSEEYLFTFLRDLDVRGAGMPPAFLHKLRRALAHYGVDSLDRSPEQEESLFRIAVSHQRQPQQAPLVLAVLERLLDRDSPHKDKSDDGELHALLDRLIGETQGREPAVHDLAREVRWRIFDRPLLLAARERTYAAAEAELSRLGEDPPPGEREESIHALVDCTQPLHARLSQRYAAAPETLRRSMLEVMLRRYYRIREIQTVETFEAEGLSFAAAEYPWEGGRVHLFATHAGPDGLPRALEVARRLAAETPEGRPDEEREVVIDLYAWEEEPAADDDAAAAEIGRLLEAAGFPARMRRLAVALASPAGVRHFTWRRAEDGGYPEERVYRGLHPLMVRRLQIWRFRNFRLDQLPAPEGVWLFKGVAHTNPRDERLFAVAEVRDLTPTRDEHGRVVHLPQLEHRFMEALAGIRQFQSRRPAGERLQWNRVLLYLWPPVDLRPEELNDLVHRLAPLTEGLGLEKVAVRGRVADPQTGAFHDRVLEISNPGEAGMVLRFRPPKDVPIKPLREYAQKIVELKRRGIVYAYEIARLLAPREPQEEIPAGEFVEHDLDDPTDLNAGDRLVPVDRPWGQNTANIVAGVIRSFTDRYLEGMERVLLLSDASHDMGALAEPECRRILAALDLAAERKIPLEWFALSAGAKIAMDSGTENMDWISCVLRKIVERTQEGLEINLVVPGINAGAQPYWNAEATMLMHTKGILIMTPQGAMVLTGKQALDYSGGVSAEDNLGIGGYERIMGPNGQAQYFARDLGEACQILLRHYEHTWVAPGERFPRPAPTRDPRERDVRDFPHGGLFRTVGEIFSEATNPGRKKPFEIRRVMQAVADQDHRPLERWYGMHDAEMAVVWEAHLGGWPVCLLGFESKPLPRLGWVPVYGPDQWTGGTLFPLSSKKVARAINAASNNRPLVVLANLSGFDGSPESMRNWQLEFGAEIGRAVVSFRGPIVFCVVSRYHGGAFVVFSNALHDNMEVTALEGSHASVIGGAPAAAVIFAREVDQRTRKDPRVTELEEAIADPSRAELIGKNQAELRAHLDETTAAVRSEKLGEVAVEFDHIHSVERALEVGSIHRILPPGELRPYLIDAIERGIEKELARLGGRVVELVETAS